MAFITKQRLAELELKESQFEHLRHKYQEQQIELEIRKRNEFSRENMINYRENMVIHEEPDTGRKVREFTTTLKTVVEDEVNPFKETLDDYLKNSPFKAK
ncbi:hypothetical protein [Lactococcus petauri]|uniref:hypothetical protein n=1 Tax=Lactococcus petauri TaxID=1940789 RepID=UPI0021D48FAC|nr:hypothetical protein [Lactococcus petauri]MCU7363619.1 hypothetical protein [Lactococcus petauri]MDA3734887.1 hypothetical protein [Lactococcus petauri]MDC7842363.1 hypothetical protein [Lactococcus petauri]